VGLWDDFTDAVSDAADAVSDAAESAYDAVSQGAVGDAIGAVGGAVDTATFGLAGAAMNAADDYVFDTVDYVTGGMVNVDFDDGNFAVSTGIDGVAQWGASIGEAGVTASGEAILGGSFDFRMTGEGFLATGSAGIDWGPLPYAAGHIQLDPNGDIKINGELQGTLPTPVGFLSGQASGGFTSTDAGWGGYWNSQGTLQMPSGVTIGTGQHLSYMQTADGDSQLAVGVDGSVSYMGATVRAGADYQRLEHDGDVVEGLHLEGEVDALGIKASAEADYVHANVDGVERSDWSGDADVDGDIGRTLQTAGRYAQSELDGDEAAGGAGDLGGADLAPVDMAPVDMGPTTELDTAVQTADAVEQSMDAMTQDLP
jgi:hypothetical protein